MVFKRYFDEEGSSSDSPSKFQKVVRYVMRDASLQGVAEKLAVMLETTLRKVMKEELELRIDACLRSSSRSSLVHHHDSSSPQGLELRFTKKLPATLFSNGRIADSDRSPLQVLLVDAHTGNVVDSGQFSSLKVEFVALRGDFATNGVETWSKTEFNDSIVREREGKRPLLVGERSVVLVNGVGSLGNVSFSDNSSWIRCRKFRLGARAVSPASVGAGVKEAVSDAFVVLDHRGESYQKHSQPSLDDPVWRLRKISKVGASRKRLELHGIKTVKDFLTLYYTNPSSLRHVLGKSVANKAWDAMVRHANDCHLDNTLYHYCSESESTVLLFNCVYKVVAVKFTDQDYQSLDSLDIYQKAIVEKVKQTAYSNLNDVVEFHDSPAISFLELPTIEPNIPFSTSSYMMHDDFTIVDQDELTANQSDIHMLDTASCPYTATEQACYATEDDSTSQADKHWFAQPSFAAGNSSLLPSDGVCNWGLDSPNITFAHDHQSF